MGGSLTWNISSHVKLGMKLQKYRRVFLPICLIEKELSKERTIFKSKTKIDQKQNLFDITRLTTEIELGRASS